MTSTGDDGYLHHPACVDEDPAWLRQRYYSALSARTFADDAVNA